MLGLVNQVVKFTASATDADAGSQLAYMWEIGEPRGGWRRVQAPEATPDKLDYKFLEPGVHRVRVVVSDRTGKSTAKTLKVSVGSYSYAKPISGRVTTADGAPLAGVKVAFVASDGQRVFDTAETDSDGTYSVARPIETTNVPPNPIPWNELKLVSYKTGYTITPVSDMELVGGVSTPLSSLNRTRIDLIAVPTLVRVQGQIDLDAFALGGSTIEIAGQTARTGADGAFTLLVPSGRLLGAASVGGLTLTPNGVDHGGAQFPIDATGPTVDLQTLEVGSAQPGAFNANFPNYVPGDGAVAIRHSYNIVDGGQPVSGTSGYSIVDLRSRSVGSTYVWVEGTSVGKAHWIPMFANPVTLTPGTAMNLQFARDTSGNIRSVSGNVQANGIPLAGATATLKNAVTNATAATATTDSNGVYVFPSALASADGYKVAISKSGYTFAQAERTVTFSNAGYATDVNFTSASIPTPAPSFSAGISATTTQVVGAVSTLSTAATGDPSIRYQWSVASGDATKVRFLGNGTEASSVKAVFDAAGTYVLAVTATDRFGRTTTNSTTQTLTIQAIGDRVQPTLKSVTVSQQTEEAVYVQFSEPIHPDSYGPGSDGLVLWGLQNNQPVSNATYTFNANTNTLRIAPQTGLYFSDGMYFVFIDDGYVFDLSTANNFGGNLLNAVNAQQVQHGRLLGDINGDLTVNFADLLILSQNIDQWNQGGATWSLGDLNFDGKVDFADLLILAQSFGHYLNP